MTTNTKEYSYVLPLYYCGLARREDGIRLEPKYMTYDRLKKLFDKEFEDCEDDQRIYLAEILDRTLSNDADFDPNFMLMDVTVSLLIPDTYKFRDYRKYITFKKSLCIEFYPREL